MSKSETIQLETPAPTPEKAPALAAGGVSLLKQRKYTVPQACKLIGVKETKFREMLRKGLMPVLRVDGRMLVVESDLESYLKRNYGCMKEEEVIRSKLQPLPEHVRNSRWLKKAS